MKVVDWKEDKRWSDRFLTQIKGILGVHLIGEPPMEEDAERNTDLMVLRMDAIRIGCRVRKNNYLNKYGNEFTIRSWRPSGAKTELTKLIEGWGDYFFYGFCDAGETKLIRWTLADMRVFRRHYAIMLARSKPGVIPGITKNNTDGSSSFAAFKWSQFPSDFVVASTHSIGNEAA
ncbi:MAG: hypothetical protein GY943_30460 [Chloroflexi bacterium]|nr:hypothetical protein [Chloroflexota bacterium]